MTTRRVAFLLACLFFANTTAFAADPPKPVKVFILAGQSNMEGQAVADLRGKDYNDGKGTLKALLDDPEKAKLVKHLVTDTGAWAVRDDVWVRYKREKQPLLAGSLSIGFAVYGGKHHFGPELQFGHVVGDHFAEQVLLIKTAWGGKSLYKDFRPPSSGGEVGPYYTKMIAEVREALANLKTDFPKYADQGYELAGFVWWHGWNDGVDPKKAVPEYEQNLVNLIHDVRKEFKAPNLPVVIGELTGPWVDAPGEWATLRKAQAAAAARSEFKGNVQFVPTHDFVRSAKESPNPGHGHHEFGNAETYFLVGDALGKGMLKLLAPPAKIASKPKDKPEPPKPTSHTNKQIEGWTISLDDRLLQAPNDELGRQALRFLEAKLSDIKAVVPADKLKKLQAVTIVLDLTHGNIGPMQYHPGAEWLKDHGYSPDLAKCVHIPRAADVVTVRNIREQPWVILHELAHAYHDQVLGFDHPRVKEAYENYKKSGRGEKALLHDGRRVRHYALTNQMEFFAEMTEAYFGSNDFFPFNRAELKESEPEIFELMEHIWKPQPLKAAPPPITVVEGPQLQQQLAKEPLADLAKAARDFGDARRGAVLFFQPFLTCARCHDAETGTQLGPDIAKAGKEATAEYLIESVLAPSKVIKKGYETLTITTSDDRTVSGLVAAETADSLTLLDPAANGKRITIAKADIVKRTAGAQSLMPDGLANLLSDRQQFLDLAKYLIEVAEGGPARAKELRPAQTALVIPEYEKDIDHSGLIRALDEKALKRGEAIYSRVCANCHGTKDQPGSLPTSPKFAQHAFKNGSDPYSLYQTLTRGYGMMAPQTWMVPRQKYDVIHYLRETYLKPHNPTQYAKADDAYFAKLPAGKKGEFGPAPTNVEPWAAMDYGPSLMNTYEIGGPGPNIAYKGIAVRLDAGSGGVSRGKQWTLFDHDTMRFAAAWTGSGFIDWKGIHFNGQHQIHPKLAGDVHVANPVGPGWANPATGDFKDPRFLGRDKRPYGPLPKEWAQFRGTYAFGDLTIISYTVGDAPILELAGSEADPKKPAEVAFTRTLEIGKSSHDLVARVAPVGVAAAVIGDKAASLEDRDGFTVLRVPANATPTRVKVLTSKADAAALKEFAKTSPAPRPLEPLTKGGPRRWPEVLRAPVTIGKSDGPFAVDTFQLPERNPWNAQLRLTGFDFLPDGKRMAVCSWDGDVWLVGGLDKPENGLTWQRIASGLFQPLGLKIRDGNIFVCCRDQIVKLHDLNGDGETDFYECFNSDHQVTEHFHEFAMGLQTDAEGNFYYAKSGRHALPALVPHHGTLLKVTKDGAKTEILATGFRAANGVCLNPDGTFFVTDQEGFWTPKNRINLVEKGGFYGNMWGYTDVTDTADGAMKQPLCWITNDFDRSPAELIWVTSDKWGPLKGSLLNTSYGMGKIFVVPHEVVNGQAQGGMCQLPLPTFPTGIMRPRFHPTEGQLYVCGMFAWAGNQTAPGGFYRVRYTGKPADLPVGLKAKSGGVELTFTDALDAKSAADPKNYDVKVWGLKRSQNYGSKHIDEKPLAVSSATLSADGKTVRLDITDLAPTWCMEIRYRVKGADGRSVTGVIHNTIHALGK